MTDSYPQMEWNREKKTQINMEHELCLFDVNCLHILYMWMCASVAVDRRSVIVDLLLFLRISFCCCCHSLSFFCSLVLFHAEIDWLDQTFAGDFEYRRSESVSVCTCRNKMNSIAVARVNWAFETAIFITVTLPLDNWQWTWQLHNATHAHTCSLTRSSIVQFNYCWLQKTHISRGQWENNTEYKQGNHLAAHSHNGKCLLIQSFEVKCVCEFVQQIKTTSNNGQIKKEVMGTKSRQCKQWKVHTQDMVDELQLCKQNVMCVWCNHSLA